MENQHLQWEIHPCNGKSTLAMENPQLSLQWKTPLIIAMENPPLSLQWKIHPYHCNGKATLIIAMENPPLSLQWKSHHYKGKATLAMENVAMEKPP